MLGHFRMAIVTAGFAFIALASQAAEPDYARTGAYIGFGAGGGFENFDDEGFNIDFDDGFVVGGWAGWRAHSNIAIEGQVEYSEFDLTFIGVDLDLELLTFTASAKVFALTDRIQPFGLVGAGVTRAELSAGGADIDDSDFSLRFGGGVDYWLTPHISLGVVASYLLTTGDVDGTDYTSVAGALQYRF